MARACGPVCEGMEGRRLLATVPLRAIEAPSLFALQLRW
jgi:hypothetical protein